MKTAYLYVLFGILAGFASKLSAQKPKLNPEDTVSFVQIQLYNEKKQPYVGEVVLRSKKGRVVKVNTDKNGKARATVPFDDEYTVHTGENVCVPTVKVNNFPYLTYEHTAYTHIHMLVNFTYTTPDNKPLAGEPVEYVSKTNGKVFVDTTNAQGKCTTYVPLDDYWVNLKYWEHYRDLVPIRKPQTERYIHTIFFKWIGSKETERLAAIADSIARVRAKEDSIRFVQLKEEMKKDLAKAVEEGKLDKIIVPLTYGEDDLVVDVVQAKAKVYKAGLAKNPKFFVEKKTIILAVLDRLKKRFPQQVVVTDVTGSMSPYMEQVAVWHALNLVPKNTYQYFFFNDGDRKPDGPIGKSGGIYDCGGQVKDLKKVLKMMSTASRNGGGGNSPENDIEALLAASKKRNKIEELVLVADNNSPVRDMVLLSQLNIPVRIIACGTEPNDWGASAVNEQYLWIAYKTGGSVHTLEEDIFDLSKIAEGKTIRVDKIEYMLTEGRFVRLWK